MKDGYGPVGSSRFGDEANYIGVGGGAPQRALDRANVPDQQLRTSSAVEAAYNRMDREVAAAHELVDRITERYAPVLRIAPPTTQTCEARGGTGVPLADGLNMLGDRLETLTGKLGELLQRCGL